MITRWRTRVMRLVDALRQWSERRRLAGWSTRRRWVVLVLLPTLLVCSCCGALALPVAWVWKLTAEANKGAVGPDVAASTYLQELSYNDELDIITVLDGDRRDELLAQWRAYRDAMQRSEAFELDFAGLTVGPVQDGRATVTVDVTAVSHYQDGGAPFLNSQALTWRFNTRDDDGRWWVTAVDAPAWCGEYVTRCPGDAGPSASASPSPSPSPSDDLLENPRSMLPCGPRDPFRSRHSCPPSEPAPIPS
ncbi:hypothetical protein AB0J80_13440 [Actinoplanes sp. NPDC049548]|uniref:hypothetical protein n=1 Tax=Actinoplanes sp. NPDC049548 TaxID=3155152 RepID=UPI003413B293